jgi:hypothetical protein
LGTLSLTPAKVFSCAVIGLDGAIVEVDTANGLPSFVDVVPDSQCLDPVCGELGWAN